MRESKTISVSSIAFNKLTAQFGRVAYLNSNNNNKTLLAVGEIQSLQFPQGSKTDPFDALREFIQELEDWAFGFLSYEMKNHISDRLESKNEDIVEWPLIGFFQPEIVVEIESGSGLLHYFSNLTDLNRLSTLIDCLNSREDSDQRMHFYFEQLVSREQYVSAVRAIQREIQMGNIYELNYCIPFETRVKGLNSEALYQRLNELTHAPFSAYYDDGEFVLMCASPERYLKKQGPRLLAQPIKGTCRRGIGAEDEILRESLRNDPKERAENIMITDLVRNDLSRVAEPESVCVEELCEIYSFKTVHQMISSIGANLRRDCDAVEALKATFPMGSMTGAPKISAMQFIEQFEIRQRGMYSGAFGYFAPNGDFDFNVVIRSMVYRKSIELLSFHVGSAITSLSDVEKEYEECMLKAEAMLAATKSHLYAE